RPRVVETGERLGRLALADRSPYPGERVDVSPDQPAEQAEGDRRAGEAGEDECDDVPLDQHNRNHRACTDRRDDQPVPPVLAQDSPPSRSELSSRGTSGPPTASATVDEGHRRVTTSSLPKPGCERTSKAPSIAALLARMFLSPWPAPSPCSSKPPPSSRTVTTRWPWRSPITTSARRAPACLRTFASPSWTIRKTSICSSGASDTLLSTSSSTSSSPSAVRNST